MRLNDRTESIVALFHLNFHINIRIMGYNIEVEIMRTDAVLTVIDCCVRDCGFDSCL